MSNPGQVVSGVLIQAVTVVLALSGSLSPLHAEQSPQGTSGQGAASESAGETEVSMWLRRAHDLAEGGSRAAAFSMLVDRGGAWLASGRTLDAITVLTAATELEPGSPEGWTRLGRAHSRNRDFGPAEEALELAVTLGDTSPSTLVFLGAVEWENGDLVAAETTYRRAVDAGGGGFPRAQLGRLMLWQGRYAEAAEELNLALGTGLTAPDVLFDLAEALRGAGRTEEAIEAYRRVNSVAPTSYKAYYGLAVSLARAGRAEESAAAFAHYEELYREDQERTRVSERNKGEMERARTLLESGQVEAALAHLGRLAQSVDVLALTARGQFLAGRTAEALASLEQAVSLDPGRADLRRLLSEMRSAAAGAGN